MLHGCTQNPTDFAAGTMMNTYGEKYNAYVLYPEQPSSANSNKCWNWFQPSDQNRGSGEPKLIHDMTRAIMDKYPSINKNRVFVAGLSAGAAQSVLMGIAYPDLYRCVGVAAGLEYKAATSTTTAYTAMSSGGPNPATQGKAAYTAEGSNAAPQCVLVIHGTSDYTVNIKNGDQVVEQYATTLSYIFGRGKETSDMTSVPTSSQDGTANVSNGKKYTLLNYDYAATGETMIKYLKVTSMGHAWSGGSNQGSYTDPTGPDASLLMVDFFYKYVDNSTTTTTTSTTTGSDTSSTTGTTGTDTTTTGTDTTTGSDTTTGTTGTTGTDTTTGTTTGTDTTTTGGLNNEMRFYSIGPESGWVGQLVADGISNEKILIGDKGMYNVNTYKGFLSFDTSGLPNDITITNAQILVYRQSLSGSLSSINVDIKDGYFGSSPDINREDFNAVASAYNVTILSIPSQDGDSSRTTLPSSAFSYIKNGADHRTQFRLSSITVGSFSPNQLTLYGGVNETEARAPVLIVNWA